MKAENATEINLKINTIKICYQYQCENENSYSDKGKKNIKDCPPQARMTQHELSVLPRWRNPGIKKIPGGRKNTHRSLRTLENPK